MGSALRDLESGDVIWGLRPGWLAKAWSPVGPGLTPLAVREDELAGKRRVEPIGLLKFPAFAPILAGFEPYHALTSAISRVVRSPQAVLEFAYDWRLPVRHNATLLGDAAHRHLEQWRAVSGNPEAGLVLVAHSMGGLLCQAMPEIDGVRAVITLGTPFDGAAKAVLILAAGEGAPLPARRLREVAVTMPGIHDLLPFYRCLLQGDTVTRLTESDAAGLIDNPYGPDLVKTAFSDRQARQRPIPHHDPLIGIDQPTISTLTLDHGNLTGLAHTFDLDEYGELRREPNGRLIHLPGRGDGTVPRNSARPPHGDVRERIPQQHTTLAQSDEAVAFVRDILLHGRADQGPRLGDGDLGVSLPDIVDPGTEWTAELVNAEPGITSMTIADADTGAEVLHATADRRGDIVAMDGFLPYPGLFRVSVDGGGSTSPVVQYVLAVDNRP
ncbi:hypothetical protein BJP25_09030 [Actinokineospora bangkokensis]|uniref:Uncharacterized protein n=2 Tax=Actinokineospora bangkokensis TaxID=1193682 RepID=A0A1Q9LSW6_9PSEU|nr:hypothetical protein BJP25_09030 [Actinokineospora bangkokensis]